MWTPKPNAGEAAGDSKMLFLPALGCETLNIESRGYGGRPSEPFSFKPFGGRRVSKRQQANLL